MTPKKTSTDQTSDVHASPFEQITMLENEQEARVAQTLERMEQEKIDAQKSLVHAEKTQESMMRDEAMEELKEYARTEPATILKKSEKDTADAMESIKSHAEKHLSATADKLLKPVLDGSVFTLSA